MKPYGTTDVKILNRRFVFDYIKDKKGQVVSRPEIAKALNITMPTVLKIIDFFLKKDILINLGESNSTAVGRKPNMICFQPDAAYSIGIDYNGKTLKIAVVNLNGETASFYSSPLKVSLQDLIEKELPKKLRTLDLDFSRVLAAGLALPTAVDPKNNIISMCNSFIDSRGQEDYSSYVDTLSHILGVPVFLENDVNAAAISQFKLQSSSGKTDLIFLMLGFGLGAGIILDGNIRRGAHYAAGEIGYMTLDLDTNTQNIDSGWLESVLSQEFIQKHFSADISEGNDLAKTNHSLIEYIASRISLIITNLSVSLDIDTFVIGGLFVKYFGLDLVPFIQKHCQKLCPYPIHLIVDTKEDTIAKGMGEIAANKVLNYYLSDEYMHFTNPFRTFANFQTDSYLIQDF